MVAGQYFTEDQEQMHQCSAQIMKVLEKPEYCILLDNATTVQENQYHYDLTD